MCLAVPMRLIEVDGERGVAALGEVRQAVNLSLVECPRIGEYVIVHAGFAIEKLDVEEADERLAYFDEIAAKAEEEPR
ncbi:MAG: HypC/HybG/HupF family hydrogenase formation chaperone [Acidobacteriota bacterium]|nr:HypC/HybG/HupF family hydrogenase formation chaperone [Acidobacteriota bacterium]